MELGQRRGSKPECRKLCGGRCSGGIRECLFLLDLMGAQRKELLTVTHVPVSDDKVVSLRTPLCPYFPYDVNPAPTGDASHDLSGWALSPTNHPRSNRHDFLRRFASLRPKVNTGEPYTHRQTRRLTGACSTADLLNDRYKQAQTLPNARTLPHLHQPDCIIQTC